MMDGQDGQVFGIGSAALLLAHLALGQSRLAQLYINALLLVIPTEVEIFYQDLYRKALLLVIPTVVEIFNPFRWLRSYRQYRAPTWFILFIWSMQGASQLYAKPKYCKYLLGFEK